MLVTMGEAKKVTGATKAGKAMTAPAAGRKRPWESTGGDEIVFKKKPQHGQDLKAMLWANCGGANASPGSSTASTKASSSVCASPLSILQSPLTTPEFDNEIPNGQADVDTELDKQFELMTIMGGSAFAATGSSEAPCGDEIIGFPEAPPTILPEPEAVPSTTLSFAPAEPPDFSEQLRKTEDGLLEPEPKKIVVESIGTATDDDAECRRWAKLAEKGFDLRSGPGQRCRPP